MSDEPGAAGGWTDGGVVGATGVGEPALRETERAMASVAVSRVTSDAPGAARGWTEGGRPGATAPATVGVVAVSRLVAVGESAAARTERVTVSLALVCVTSGEPGAAGGWIDGGVVGATGVGESVPGWGERATVSVAVLFVPSGEPGG
jgi:hypothetical protein